MRTRKRILQIGVIAVSAVGLLGLSPSSFAASGEDLRVANLGSAPAGGLLTAAPSGTDAGPAAAVPFPSAASTVIGSVGFIDSDEVGYFWSMARGDSVTEVIAGPNKIKKAILKIEVVTNGLVAGSQADWDLEINGNVVGSFVVASGDLGPVKVKAKFPRITGGEYEVAIRMTNEVVIGGGAHTLAYAGAYDHSITLKKK